MQDYFYFKNVELQTNKLSELWHFYARLLEFQVFESTSDAFSIQFKCNTLTFHQTEVPAYYHFAINIPENHITAASQYLKERGIRLISFDNQEIIDFSNWNAHSLYFFDPAQNVVEFIARHNIKNRSEKKFHPKLAPALIEIGLVVDDFETVLALIYKGFSLQKYIGAGDYFMPIGHEQSLFICVPKNRNWFPTNLKSQQFPLKITLKNKLTERVLSYQNETYVVKF